jgi:NAD-dependent deacetylase
LNGVQFSEDAVRAAAKSVVGARNLGVFIGSGLSLASGIPTYRDATGTYVDPEVARFSQTSTFETDRQAMLFWYEEQRRKLKEIHPNAGHHALARIAKMIPTSFVTQNVDGLLERALAEESADAEVFPLHGRLARSRCHVCRRLENREVDLGQEPLCRSCGGSLRPDVVWFGEMLARDVWQGAMDSFTEIQVCLVIGTSGLVYPASELPELAESRGVTLIEINTADTVLTDTCQHVLRGHAEAILPILVDELRASEI